VRLMLMRVDDGTNIGLGLRLARSRGNRRHPALPDGQGWWRLRLNVAGGAPSMRATARYSHRRALRQGAGGVHSREAWVAAGSVSPRALSLWRSGKLGFGGSKLSPFHEPSLPRIFQCEVHPPQ
jgi:hypothetical protein